MKRPIKPSYPEACYLIEYISKLNEYIDFLENIQEQSGKYDVGFLTFFDAYHEITGLSKTDKEAAWKYWKKLKLKEKVAAMNNIKPYSDSISDKKYCKKARTYLADKNFNDEFKPKQSIWNNL